MSEKRPELDDELLKLWRTDLSEQKFDAIKSALRSLAGQNHPQHGLQRVLRLPSTKHIETPASWRWALPTLAPAMAALLFVLFLPIDTQRAQQIVSSVPTAQPIATPSDEGDWNPNDDDIALTLGDEDDEADLFTDDFDPTGGI